MPRKHQGMDQQSFDSERIALGYANRPWLHRFVIEQLRADCHLEPDFMFQNGLDAGCGAGLSTKALRLICRKVTGTDIAESMIAVCRNLYGDDPACSFYVAKAEETEIPDKKYDIVTAAGCINWVDEKKFLAKNSSWFSTVTAGISEKSFQPDSPQIKSTPEPVQPIRKCSVSGYPYAIAASAGRSMSES